MPRSSADDWASLPEDTRGGFVDGLLAEASFRVPNLWLVDPDGRSIEGLVLESGGYRRSYLAERGVVQVPGFEGLVLDLDARWGEVDQLG